MQVNAEAEHRGVCSRCLRLEKALERAIEALENSASLTLRQKEQLLHELRRERDGFQGLHRT